MLQAKVATSDASDAEVLRRLNDDFIRAVQNSDVALFEKILADDFFNSNPDGTLIDRAAFLKQIARPITIRDLAVEDVRIRFFGDTAIIHARTTYKYADGRPGQGRYTDVWVRQGGRWLCVSAHVTRG